MDEEQQIALRRELQIKKNKDKTDLKPGVDFVSQHTQNFEDGYRMLLERKPTKEAREWVAKIEFVHSDKIVKPQVSPEQAQEILSRMPSGLIELSKLRAISYVGLIPVPGFDDDGNLDQSKVRWVAHEKFPGQEDHPSRILVGLSNGTEIYPTPIPPTVSKDERATYLYQVHVFIHEFFHTIDYPRRSSDARKAILLETDGQQFTFQDWWDEFERLILSDQEPANVSHYAEIYKEDLNEKTKQENVKKYTTGLAEQMAESFVAHQLGIVSNNDGWTNFKEESFGNKEQQEKFLAGKAPNANLKWELIDKLCRAKVIKQDN